MLPYMRDASKRATEIFQETGVRSRIDQDGYTRVDPFLVAESQGIPVLLRPMDKLLGAFVRDRVSGILINSERPAGLIHMTCAHELGHYFMGHQTTADDSMDFSPHADRLELEADWFAYQLLAPRLLIASLMRRKRLTIQALKHPTAMYQLALRLGISYSATIWSMVRQGLLPRDDSKKLLAVEPSEIKSSILGGRPLDPRKDVWLIDDRDRSCVIEPRIDDQILVRLSSRAASGYLWSVDELVSKGFAVRPLSSKTEVAEVEQTVFGRPQSIDFVLNAPAGECGEGVIRQFAMQLTRPWSGGNGAVDRFELKAQFECIAPGLTRAGKANLLGGM